MCLRSRQAGGDLGAGARMSGIAAVTGTASARMSNMKRIPVYGGCLQVRARSALCADSEALEYPLSEFAKVFKARLAQRVQSSVHYVY